MKILFAVLCLIPSLSFAQNSWNMGVEKDIADLKQRMDRLEKQVANWNLGQVVKDADRESFAKEAYKKAYEEGTRRLNAGEDAYPALEASDAYRKALKEWDEKYKTSAIDCPCQAGGDCICETGDCRCENCKEHPYKWKGSKPTNKGREVLVFGADWCQNCPAAYKRLGKLTEQIYFIDCSKDDTQASLYRVDAYPTMIAIEDGIKVPSLHTEGDSVGPFFAGKWLNKQDGVKTQSPPVVRKYVQPSVVRSSQPNTPGHSHRCGRCGATWSHENWNVGNPVAHTCPSCGYLEYGNRTEGWGYGRPRQSRPVYQSYQSFRPNVVFPSSGSFCPTCPR